jgi:hypothetical protein
MKEQMLAALQAHTTAVENTVTANRVQTLRYVDRKIQPLVEGQDILLGMIAEMDEKMTKTANKVRRELVSAETKG